MNYDKFSANWKTVSVEKYLEKNRFFFEIL